MATLNFTVATASSLEAVKGQQPNLTVYAEDLGLGQPCVEETGSAWACLTCDQQVFQNVELTNIVPDGFYLVKFSSGIEGIWHIVNGFPQGTGFTGDPAE